MTDRIAYARNARETIHAYIQKYPGKLSEDIAYNNIRINKEMVLRTLRHLGEVGLVRKEGNRQCARFYPVGDALPIEIKTTEAHPQSGGICDIGRLLFFGSDRVLRRGRE